MAAASSPISGRYLAEQGGEEMITLARWVAEDLVGFGTLRLGLPGLTALILVSNPLVEAVPKILRDRSVGKLPMLPYTAMTSAGIIWFAYAALMGLGSLLIVNGVQTILGFYYCWTFWRFCPESADWLPWSVQAHLKALALTILWCAVVVATLSQSAPFLLGVGGNAACILMFAGPLAAVDTVVQEQSTRTLPFGFTCAVAVNSALWTVYAAAVLQDPMVLLPNFIGFLLGLAQLSLFLRYGIHTDKPQDGREEGSKARGEEDVELTSHVGATVLGTPKAARRDDL